MLDIGCGLEHLARRGVWLGVKDVFGVDGDWLDNAALDIEPAAAGASTSSRAWRSSGASTS